MEIRSELSVIKNDQKNLTINVEKLAVSLEKITESIKNDHNELRRDYEKLMVRLTIIENTNSNKEKSVNTWVAPMIQHSLTALIAGFSTSAFWVFSHLLHNM